MKFGQYELLERVAIGGMAEVYRGRVAGAEGFEKWVAIKRILPEYARDERFISMMLTEARIHSALSHRNIVQIHDLGISEDGEYFIVLEYVEGHDLRAVMEAAAELGVQIPDSLALHVADELAQALHFAHELTDPDGQPLGIIHRDVSPSNVLISNSGEVKLSDFGIAKRRHDHSFVGSLKGNLVYMSPEQARRQTLDRRTDVFSLGAVLFEMLTGHKVREITDEVSGFREVASGVVRSARELRPDLPEAYEALLSRALASDPAQRFPDAAAFGAAIRELRRESDSPVGPADMKELIEVLNPPRRARSPVERSKVIRLGPEYKVLAGPNRTTRAGTFARVPNAPVAPPVPALAPGVIPPEAVASKSNGNAGPVWADSVASRLAAATPSPLSAMNATPPPPVIAPPPSLRTPAVMGSLAASPLISPLTPSLGGQLGQSGTPRLSSSGGSMDAQATPPPPAAVDMVTPLATLATLATARSSYQPAEPSGPVLSMPTPPPSSSVYAPPASSQPGEAARPAAPGGVPSALPDGSLPSDPASSRPNLNRPYLHNSAAVPTTIISLPRRRGPWGAIVVLLLVALSAGAAVVHYKVVPLDVAVVWFKPALLSVTSDPPGATLTLDGRAVPDATPTHIEIKRDRSDHVLEATKDGSLPVRATVRFDRSVALSEAMTLPPAPPPPLPPPVETKPAVPEPPVAVATEQVQPTAKARKKSIQHSKQIAKKKAKKKKGKHLH